MTEPHQLLAGLDLLSQIRFRSRRIADLEDHVERRTGRAAVQRTLQRADGSDDCGHEIGSGRSDHSRRECRRVEAVVDDSVEIRLQAADPLGRGDLSAQHIEGIRRVTEIRSRRDRRAAGKQPPVGRDDRRKCGEERARVIGVIRRAEDAGGHGECVH